MNNIDLVETGRLFLDKYDKPTLLYQSGQHAVYWLGFPEDTAFRINSYLIVDGSEAVVVDPGGANAFAFTLDRIRQILPAESVNGLILCHQDPDVAASMVQWLEFNPELKVVTSIRTNVLLPHYGKGDYNFFNIGDTFNYSFLSGEKLRFIEAPFLHFPGAFVTIDELSGFLFSGDIWAAIDMDWRLVVEDFSRHELKMSLFHVDYMASNLACRGFIKRLGNFLPKAILPQHGSIIPEKHVPKAIHYLSHLKCGTDLIYGAI